MKTIHVRILTALLATIAVSAQAETFRCGQWIITSDITVQELTKKCGSPTSETIQETNMRIFTEGSSRSRTGVSTRKVWTYDRGTQAAAMVVTILDDKIESIARKR